MRAQVGSNSSVTVTPQQSLALGMEAFLVTAVSSIHSMKAAAFWSKRDDWMILGMLVGSLLSLTSPILVACGVLTRESKWKEVSLIVIPSAVAAPLVEAMVAMMRLRTASSHNLSCDLQTYGRRGLRAMDYVSPASWNGIRAILGAIQIAIALYCAVKLNTFLAFTTSSVVIFTLSVVTLAPYEVKASDPTGLNGSVDGSNYNTSSGKRVGLLVSPIHHSFTTHGIMVGTGTPTIESFLNQCNPLNQYRSREWQFAENRLGLDGDKQLWQLMSEWDEAINKIAGDIASHAENVAIILQELAWWAKPELYKQTFNRRRALNLALLERLFDKAQKPLALWKNTIEVNLYYRFGSATHHSGRKKVERRTPYPATAGEVENIYSRTSTYGGSFELSAESPQDVFREIFQLCMINTNEAEAWSRNICIQPGLNAERVAGHARRVDSRGVVFLAVAEYGLRKNWCTPGLLDNYKEDVFRQFGKVLYSNMAFPGGARMSHVEFEEATNSRVNLFESANLSANRSYSKILIFRTLTMIVAVQAGGVGLLVVKSLFL